jgi:serine/threonine protein kinase
MEAALAEEAPLIARLEHPCIVPVHECGTLPDGRAWYAMKLVAGQRLDRYMESTPTLPERLRVFRRVCDAVGYAHSCGVLHRDLKPQNVMVGTFGEVYVMDWGVAAVAGTPAFRAPESKIDERSDVYALGALLAFLTGEDAPPALRAVAAKAMHPSPDARYESPADLLTDLSRFEDGLAVEAWQEPLWHGMRRFASRNAVLLWLLVAFAVVKAALYFARGRS